MLEPFGRIDTDKDLEKRLLKYCRLKKGEVWIDKKRGHKVGVLDATVEEDVRKLFGKEKSSLAIQDPPYNVVVGNKNSKALSKVEMENYINFSRMWIENNIKVLSKDASFYLWLGADQRDSFQPLAEMILLMREFPELKSRCLITMRNQRGYGTQKNWMALRQECLYYIKGHPTFNVEAEYTDIPKVLRGYYKKINGKKKENIERSKSEYIRAGNVWIDIQQVFYLMKENVPGCYAQKPIKAIDRIIRASSNEGAIITDFFAHSGTTLIAGERNNRKVFTMDLNPVFAELTIRRLEHFRKTGELGFQCMNPFENLK